jgi:hypothetical protein
MSTKHNLVLLSTAVVLFASCVSGPSYNRAPVSSLWGGAYGSEPAAATSASPAAPRGSYRPALEQRTHRNGPCPECEAEKQAPRRYWNHR